MSHVARADETNRMSMSVARIGIGRWARAHWGQMGIRSVLLLVYCTTSMLEGLRDESEKKLC